MANIDYDSIETYLNGIECPVHGQKANILVNKSGLLFSNCCCAMFEDFLTKEFLKQVDKQMFGDIE